MPAVSVPRMVAGIDLGSGKTKVLLLDETGRPLAKGLSKTSADFAGIVEKILGGLLASLGRRREEVRYVATTGLGRYALGFRDLQITEITCGAKGASHLFPGTRSILDIGAQSSRAVKLGEKGRVAEFKTNEKCAAGSGGFLEVN